MDSASGASASEDSPLWATTCPAGVEGDGWIACQVGHLSDERLKPRTPVEQARQRRVHVRRVAHHMHFLAECPLSEQAIERRKPHRQSRFDDDHARR